MPRSVVTGGAGFLGSHLCERLLAEGHSVVAVDNLLTGSRDNLKGLRKNPKFTFVRQDVTEELTIPGKVDFVLHFASAASPVDYARFGIQTLKANALGTHRTLGLAKAKKARYLLASTSEVYGDPEVNPQPETYWGHVNPIGPRSVYDEGKRFAEALSMAYHHRHNLPVRVVRIFNSIVGTEPVWLLNDHRLHLEPIERYFDGRKPGASVFVPCFDPSDGRVKTFWASAVLQIPFQGLVYTLTTTYGRSVTVTGDHSVFTHDSSMRPRPIPVSRLKRGMRIAVPARLDIPTVDVKQIDIARHIIETEPEPTLWEFDLWDSTFRRQIVQKRVEIFHYLIKRLRPKIPGSAYASVTRWKRSGCVPLAIVKAFGLTWTNQSRISCSSGPRPALAMKNRVRITNDVLWLLGLYLAEGCRSCSSKSYHVTLASDGEYIRRASKIIESGFGVHVGQVPYTPGGCPSAHVSSKAFAWALARTLGLGEKRVPSWILQLPLERAKHFLQGYNDGDGTHSGKYLGRRIDFTTSSLDLANDLRVLLLKFGVVAAIGRYTTTYKQMYGDRRFPFYRISLRGLSTYDILRWDRGLAQTIQRKRTGDIVWAQVKHIIRKRYKGFVYDLSVPGAENFVAGEGVFCHNTYGPRMRLSDGRVIPNFIGQALGGQPLTVYGDGSQTRSFCFVDDLIEGIWRLLTADAVDGPVNLGNPDERTIGDMAAIIQKLMGKEVGLLHKPLPPDDPKVRCPDITKARKILGWEPKVPLEDGLRRTIAFYREQGPATRR